MISFTIMVDSSCDLPSDYLREHGVAVLPMPFDLDGRAHDLGYWQEISGQEYYGALRNGSVAKTSQINLNLFVTVFTEYAKQGKDLLFTVLSSGLSATYRNAVIALEEVKALYPQCNIFVVDSVNASSGHGLLTMLAVKKRSEGLSAEETALWLDTKKHHCLAFFTVDDLMYLHRGGRLSKFSAIAGSVLSIKPMLNIASDGTLCMKEKARGQRAALKLMVDQIKRSVEPGAQPDTALISHTDCLETARLLAGIVEESVGVRNIIVMLMGPIIGAHLGPGAVTLSFEADITRKEYERKFYNSL